MLGIYSQLDWFLGLFGKRASDFSIYTHIIPTIYFILYTFLLRRAVLFVLKADLEGPRQKMVEIGYVVISLLVYLGTLLV